MRLRSAAVAPNLKDSDDEEAILTRGRLSQFLGEYAERALIVDDAGLHTAYVTKPEANMESVSRRKYRIRATETSTLNSYNFTELRRGYNKIGLGVVFHVARDKVRVTRKRGTEKHLVIGIGKVRS